MNKMNQIQVKIQNLLNLMEKQRKSFRETLGNGVTLEIITSQIQIHPIPDDIITLYSTVEGRKTNQKVIFSNADFIPGYRLLSIYEINSEIMLLKEKFDNDENLVWQSDMIPFLKSESSDYYCIKLQEDNYPIYSIPHDSNIYIMYLCFEHFIDITTELYVKNAYSFNKEKKYIDINFPIFREIYLKYCNQVGLQIN